ncbi:hypothetical protein U1Q18_022148 [Sarracenia purpurea var. burkii]
MEHSFEPPVNPSWDLLTCSVCWSNLINPVHNVEGQLDESLGLRAHLIDAKQIGVQISARIRASWRLNADKSSALMGQQRSDTKASPSPSLVPGVWPEPLPFPWLVGVDILVDEITGVKIVPGNLAMGGSTEGQRRALSFNGEDKRCSAPEMGLGLKTIGTHVLRSPVRQKRTSRRRRREVACWRHCS